MRYSLLILSACVVLSSCTKVEEQKSKQELLRAEKWTLSDEYIHAKWKADGTTVPVTVDNETRVDIPGCTLDDIWVFREGNDGARQTGVLPCTINETAEIEFRWGLTDNDTKMYIYDDKEFFNADVNAELIEFYDDKFAIRYEVYKDKAVSMGGEPAVWLRDTTIYTMYFKKYVPPPAP